MLYLLGSEIFVFKHFFRVRQFLGISYVAKASKKGLLKNTKKSLNQKGKHIRCFQNERFSVNPK